MSNILRVIMRGAEHPPAIDISFETEEHVAPEIHDECGFAVVTSLSEHAGQIAIRAAAELSNRGREANGVAVQIGQTIIRERNFGTAKKSYPDCGEAFDQRYRSRHAVAHTRYPNQGSQDLSGAQPHNFGISGKQGLTEASHVHNGNLINVKELAESVGLKPGKYSSDSEVMGYSFAHEIMRTQSAEPNEPISLRDIAVRTLQKFKGAFSGAIMWEGQKVAFCDPNGLRPAVIGELPDGGIMVTSEVTALDANDAVFVREMEPGELVVMNPDGTWTAEQWATPEPNGCLVDATYIMREEGSKGTEAVFRGMNIKKLRYDLGRELANNDPVNADIVFGVPNSAVRAGRGYAAASGIEYKQGLISKSVVKSFIGPNQAERRARIRDKIEVDAEVIQAVESIVLIDDSLIRGTTMSEIITMLKEVNPALQVHVRIALPQVKYICELGIDMQSTEELIAANLTNEEIAKQIGADTVTFLSNDQVQTVLAEKAGDFCTGCMTGDYPVHCPVAEQKNRSVSTNVQQLIAA